MHVLLTIMATIKGPVSLMFLKLTYCLEAFKSLEDRIDEPFLIESFTTERNNWWSWYCKTLFFLIILAIWLQNHSKNPPTLVYQFGISNCFLVEIYSQPIRLQFLIFKIDIWSKIFLKFYEQNGRPFWKSIFLQNSLTY